MKIPKAKKSPLKRKEIPSQHRHPQLFTRDELRTAIRHDHSYAVSTSTPLHPSFLRSIAGSSSGAIMIPLNDQLSDSKPQSDVSSILIHQLSEQPFRIDSIVDDDSAIAVYTSFPTYIHFMICYNYLGEAVNQLIYQIGPDQDVQRKRVLRHNTLSGKNEFFLYYVHTHFDHRKFISGFININYV
jgi:hypothetical protein